MRSIRERKCSKERSERPNAIDLALRSRKKARRQSRGPSYEDSNRACIRSLTTEGSVRKTWKREKEGDDLMFFKKSRPHLLKSTIEKPTERKTCYQGRQR